MNPPVHYLEANGLRFAYLEEGRGPLVLLLHGFPDSARSWDPLRAKLAAAGYRAVSPWLRGYAPSAIPPRDTDMATLARDALGLIEALAGPRAQAIVVGHDWGAVAAYGAAALGPVQVRKLVVLAIPHPATLTPSLARLWAARHFILYKLPGAASRFARNDFAALRAIYQRWSPSWSAPPEDLAPVRASFAERASLDAAFGYYRQLPLRAPPFLRAPITIPTVAFAGLDDPFVTPADFLAARRMFTTDYVVEQMHGGHFMHREHPDEFAAKLLAQLSR